MCSVDALTHLSTRSLCSHTYVHAEPMLSRFCPRGACALAHVHVQRRCSHTHVHAEPVLSHICTCRAYALALLSKQSLCSREHVHANARAHTHRPLSLLAQKSSAWLLLWTSSGGQCFCSCVPASLVCSCVQASRLCSCVPASRLCSCVPVSHAQVLCTYHPISGAWVQESLNLTLAWASVADAKCAKALLLTQAAEGGAMARLSDLPGATRAHEWSKHCRRSHEHFAAKVGRERGRCFSWWSALCVAARIHACVYVFVHACVCVFVSACLCVCVCVCMGVRAFM